MKRALGWLVVLGGICIIGCGEDDTSAGPTSGGGAAGGTAGSGGSAGSGGTGGSISTGGSGGGEAQWPAYDQSPHVITVASDMPTLAGRGGIIVHDLDGDGLLDYVLAAQENDYGAGRAGISAYAWDGSVLWFQDDVDIQMNGNSENYGLPGWSGPGVAAADVDDDGQAEVVHLNTNNEVVLRNGLDGSIESTLGPFGVPSGATRWAHLAVADLRGSGDHDLILQADPLPFRWLKAVRVDTGETLWDFSDYRGCNHNGFRAADLDGDGLDEVAGAIMVDDDGTRWNDGWDYRSITGHFDSVFMYDVKPSVAGIEVIMLEESHVGDDRTAVFNSDELFFYASRSGDEPQNAAVGEFDTSVPGLEVWNRSRFDTAQLPWVIDSDGNVIAEWVMNDVKPSDWSTSGIEQINSIDWDGGARQYLGAKERHTSGKIGIIDAMDGTFVEVWDEQCDRIYVVDVAGDAREEMVVVNDAAKEIRVYFNAATNPNPPKPRLWLKNHYRRQKQNYNYYSP
jgi:hypothetical protein